MSEVARERPEDPAAPDGEANGISHDGRTVSGMAINPDGNTEAFVATVCGQPPRQAP
jgi:hypothetical protein